MSDKKLEKQNGVKRDAIKKPKADSTRTERSVKNTSKKKRVVKSTKKGKRSLSASGRNLLRKSIAGVLLASSLVVAAIPSDHSGSAMAAGELDSFGNETLSYTDDATLPRNNNISDSELPDLSFLKPTSTTDIYTSYEIRNLAGSETLIWLYEYYLNPNPSQTSFGVISGFNSDFATKTLQLRGKIINGYEMITQKQFEDYFTSDDVSPIVFDVEDPYSLSNSTTISECEKYFSTAFSSYKTQYDNAVKEYVANCDPADKDLYKTDFSKLQINKFHKTIDDLISDDEMKKIYYCDHNYSSKYHSLMTGYTLVSVTNGAQNQSYQYEDSAGNSKTGTIPPNSNIYVPKRIDGKEVPGTTDKNGYLILSDRMITAIGEKAFANASNVENLVADDNIAYIGDGAFLNSSLLASVDFASLKYVGNNVFQGCSNLSSINLSDNVKVIGKEAFRNCNKLTEVVIPKDTKAIGFGAFADCITLKTVDFTKNAANICSIGEYAFYGDTSLEEVKFNTLNTYSIGKASFALDAGTGTTAKLKTFNFPLRIATYESAANGDKYSLKKKNGDSYTAVVGDYLFANRNNLTDVTFPNNYGSSTTPVETLPMNVFSGCKDLSCVQFNDGNKYLEFDDNLFKDVENKELYVKGPSSTSSNTNNNGFAYPRTSTWACTTVVSDYVPYVYELFGEEHYEVGIGDATTGEGYRYELKVNNNGTAELQSCTPMDNTKTEDYLKTHPFVVPGEVAGYNVKTMQEGCLDSVNPYIVHLVIDDNSIENIGDSTFEASPKLESVILRNSVKTIGDSAFADCPKLEKVFLGENIASIGASAFSGDTHLTDIFLKEPSSSSTLSSIGTDAFKTGSKQLTLHGIMENGYKPFDYAMNSSNTINDDSVNIAYMTPSLANFEDGVSSHMTAIKDLESGLVTLIDYPQYYDLPMGDETNPALRYKYEHDLPLNATELDMLDATLYINVPTAVESIDVAKYLSPDSNNKNKKNFVYISDDVVSPNTYSKRKLYGSAGVGADFNLSDYTPGLFSAYFVEDPALKGYGETSGELSYDTKGNDWILSVDLPGVKSLPDNCFDSCERLESVSFSNYCQEIGESCFKGCDKLVDIDPMNSTKYDFDNYILYEEKNDGTLELNTCLPKRGENRDVTEIWVETANDPLLDRVSSIKPGAFESCQYITEADLSDTDIEILPENCFKGCDKLNTVILPETIKSVRKNSFENGSSVLDITIPANTQISDEAFDKKSTVTIETYSDCGITANYAATNGATIYIRYLNSDHTITYLNDDLTIYEQITVSNGANGFLPDNNPSPKLASHQGYKFSTWHFDNPNGFKKVTENRQAIAEFTPNGSTNPSDPSKTDPTNPTDPSKPKEGEYVVTVTSGTGSGNYKPGDTVNITAYASSTPGQVFDKWTTSNTDLGFNNPTAATTAFIMPSHDVAVTATYKAAGQTDNKTPSQNSVSNNTVKYNVTVENGAGSGQYEAGRVVTITAYASPDEKKVFDKWTTSNTDIGFSSATSSSTTFVMPTHDVKVTATYKTATATNNTASNNNANKTNNNNTTNTTNVSGNNTNKPNGSDVVVTTDTIDNNHKNLVSATVAGSTDNFVVKITDSAAAEAQVEAALRAKYGNDLSNIKYVAFDISLYDETGDRKIENFDNLAVTITVPIPDELVSYAGNNQAAAIINGAIDDKTVKFTTIDGVPCMTFTATHFSPYTIYVNTQRLLNGIQDTTPKTGDGIAPKWFLSLGLALGAAGLFLYKEQKKLPAVK